MALSDRSDIDSREAKITRATTVPVAFAWAIRLAAAFIFLVGLGYLVASVAPFHPLTVHHVSVEPAKTCPNGPVQVQIDRTLLKSKMPPPQDVQIEIISKWRNIDSGRYTPEQSVTLKESDGELGKWGREEMISPVLRSAPPAVGTWRLITTYEVSGNPLYLNRAYSDEIAAQNLLMTDRDFECGV